MRIIICFLLLLFPFLAAAQKGGEVKKLKVAKAAPERRKVRKVIGYRHDSIYPNGKVGYLAYYNRKPLIRKYVTFTWDSTGKVRWRNLVRKKAGRTVKSTIVSYWHDGHKSKSVTKYYFESDEKRRLLKCITQSYSYTLFGILPKKDNTIWTSNVYGQNGKLMESLHDERKDPNPRLEKYLYDAKDSLVKKQAFYKEDGAYKLTFLDTFFFAEGFIINYNYSSVNDTFKLSHIDSTQSDSKGRLLLRSSYSVLRSDFSRLQYDYDSTGSLIRERYESNWSNRNSYIITYYPNGDKDIATDLQGNPLYTRKYKRFYRWW